MGPDNKPGNKVFFNWLSSAPVIEGKTWSYTPPSKSQPSVIAFKGVNLKAVMLDEFADFTDKEGEAVPPQKTFGKWIPTRKDGKLIADGMVVRRNDSGEPDVVWVTMPKSNTDELLWDLANQSKPIKLDPGKISWTPLTNPKKQQQATGPVAALNGAQAAYNKLVQQAKNTNLHIDLFKKNIKSLTHALSLSIPEQVTKLLEKQAVEDYSKHFAIYNAAEEEVK